MFFANLVQNSAFRKVCRQKKLDLVKINSYVVGNIYIFGCIFNNYNTSFFVKFLIIMGLWRFKKYWHETGIVTRARLRVADEVYR